jgi:hypothetical protein
MKNINSYHQAKAILAELDEHLHVSQSKEGHLEIEQGFRDLTPLIDIECFVNKVLESSGLAYEEIKNEEGEVVGVKEKTLAEFYPKIKTFYGYSYLSDRYELSEQVKLFFVVIEEFHHLLQISFKLPITKYRGKVLSFHEGYKYFNDFVQRLREQGVDRDFLCRKRRRERNSRDSTLSAKRYVNQLFELKSKLLVVRVDLSYYKEYASSVTPELARKHRERLLNNLRSKAVFRDCVGYIWKLEWGCSKGAHGHYLFFFDGNKKQKHQYLGDQIGVYWKEKVTDGLGTYFNVNRKKYKYNGVGMIDHSDIGKRKILTDIVIPYMTKQEQFLRAKTKGMRTFGKGTVNQVKGNLGRPRKIASVVVHEEEALA